jgi:hypothetical protein
MFRHRRNDQIPWTQQVSRNRRNDKISLIRKLNISVFKMLSFSCFCTLFIQGILLFFQYQYQYQLHTCKVVLSTQFDTMNIFLESSYYSPWKFPRVLESSQYFLKVDTF